MGSYISWLLRLNTIQTVDKIFSYTCDTCKIEIQSYTVREYDKYYCSYICFNHRDTNRKK